MTKQCFFEGWYFWHQWADHTMAFIPAHHRDGNGKLTASLQVITETGSGCLNIPIETFRVERSPLRVWAGESVFSPEGCCLNCTLGGERLSGVLRYGPAASPKYDIMGPFRFVPGLQCRHGVWSLDHTVEGTLTLGGRRMQVRGRGYVEGDRGLSFPKRYLWTHCVFPGGSLMLSVADVPLGPGMFIGCVGFVWLNGRELRLATYRGLRVLSAGGAGAVVRQGPWQLEAALLEGRPQPLRAPELGRMGRTIHESAACRVQFRLTKDGAPVLDFVSDRAGFEADWPEVHK